MFAPESTVWFFRSPDRRHGNNRGWPGDKTIRLGAGQEDEESLPRDHPGPLDARHGWQEHRMELCFSLDSAPERDFTLELVFHAANGPCPDLAVELGGHRGVFHPAVSRPTRDRVHGTGPTAGDGALDIALPGSWFHAGPNELAITTTLDGDLVEQERTGFHRHYGSFGSSLQWESVKLLAGATPPSLQASVTPTPFFAGREGSLREIMDVAIRVPAGSPWPGSATLSADGRDYPLDLTQAGRDFGDVRRSVAVPELPGPADVTVDVAGISQTSVVRPCRKWTMHLIPHVHLDIGYTDYQGKVLELHSRNLDRAMAVHERNPGFRFSVDGALIISEFLQTRQPEQRARLLSALRDRQIGVNAFHSLFLSGLPTLEELYRYAYLSADLREDYGVPVDYANLTDVPSYSMAVPSVLRALGIDSFAGIENHGRGANEDSDNQHEISPVWWEGPDGSRVLAYFSDQYSQLRHMVGDPQTIEGATQAFGRFLARYEREDYLPSDIPIVGSHCDNEDLAAGDVDLVARWNEKYAWPRLKISAFADYFDAVRPFGDRLPFWRGDGGSYWEDGVGAAASAMADYRRAQMLVPLAESLAALAGLHGAVTQPNRRALERGWDGLLIGGEHTWTWAHGYHHPGAEQTHDQEAWKRHRIAGAYRIGIDELRRAMSQLGESVSTEGPTLLVYNGLSWPRTVDAELDLPGGTDIAEPGTGLECLSSESSDRDRLDRVRVTVPDVPAFGYRALPLGGNAGRPGPPDWQPVQSPLRTGRWEVTLDPGDGRVTGLVHRPTGRQLLDPGSPWALGEVLYASAGEAADRYAQDRLSGPDPLLPEPDITITPAAVRFTGARRTFDGVRLRACGSAPSLPAVEIDILLRDTCDRIDVTVTLHKERALRRESVYVAFPFAATAPRVRWDRQQGWVDPSTDHTPGACNEWFTIQHAVSVDGDNGGVVWTSADAPLFVIGDVVRGTWQRRFPGSSATVLSWVMNNYWPTNTPPDQEGTMTLRYAFTPVSGFDPASASRFGREVRTPAAVSEVTWLDKDDTGPRPLGRDTGRLADLGVPGTISASIFPARRADGLLIRLQDLSGEPAAVSLRTPFGPGSSAVLCYADERPVRSLPVGPQGHIDIELTRFGVASLIVSRTGYSTRSAGTRGLAHIGDDQAPSPQRGSS